MVRPDMRRYLRSHKGITAFCILSAFLLLGWLWLLAAPIRGRLAAHVDMHGGRYQLLGYGLASPTRSEYASCLRERYKIEFRPVAGCIVSESLVSYVNAYDSVLGEATRRKFGRDVFQECADEAATKLKAQHAAARNVAVAIEP
jgi:hypothetical protein